MTTNPARLFPIIDAVSAKHALLALYQPANDEMRAKHPEVEQAVLARAAEFGVQPSERKPGARVPADQRVRQHG